MPATSTVSIAAFTALWAAAMAAYPGWNAFDSASIGHSWWQNFLCDLLSAQTPDGRDNALASLAMTGATLALVFGSLLPIWLRYAPRSGPRRTLYRSLVGLAVLLATLIAVEQAWALPLPHGTATLAAGMAGLAPTAVVMQHDWRFGGSRLRRVVSLLVLAAVGTNFVSYAMVQAGGELTPVVPTAQKLALVFLLLWLLLLGQRRPLARASSA
ncbi:MAG: hypothetical protein AB8H80_09420 [Planctomycetota bacterium]